MRFAVFANMYDCPFLNDWRKGIGQQIDLEFDIVYYIHEEMNGALLRILDDYDAILFLDIDDIPQPALVSTAKQCAKNFPVTGFGMRLFGEQEGLFGAGVNLNAYNAWGFGNTVYRAEVLKKLLPLTTDHDTAKRAQEAGYYLHFQDLPLIHYRRYSDDQSDLEKVGGRWVWRIS